MLRGAEYLRQKADENDPLALFWMGYYHYNGTNDFVKDPALAYGFYKRAYDIVLLSQNRDNDDYKKILPDLKLALGDCLYQGLGASGNRPSAGIIEGMKYIREAAEAGNQDAIAYQREHKKYFSLLNIFLRFIGPHQERYKIQSRIIRLLENFRVFAHLRKLSNGTT
jgi:TPR repeat protein